MHSLHSRNSLRALLLSCLMLLLGSCLRQETSEPEEIGTDLLEDKTQQIAMYMVDAEEWVGLVLYTPHELKLVHSQKPAHDMSYQIEAADQEGKRALEIFSSLSWEEKELMTPGYLFFEGYFDEQSRTFQFYHWYLKTPFPRIRYGTFEREVGFHHEDSLTLDDFRLKNINEEELSKYLSPKFYTDIPRDEIISLPDDMPEKVSLSHD